MHTCEGQHEKTQYLLQLESKLQCLLDVNDDGHPHPSATNKDPKTMLAILVSTSSDTLHARKTFSEQERRTVCFSSMSCCQSSPADIVDVGRRISEEH